MKEAIHGESPILNSMNNKRKIMGWMTLYIPTNEQWMFVTNWYIVYISKQTWKLITIEKPQLNSLKPGTLFAMNLVKMIVKEEGTYKINV